MISNQLEFLKLQGATNIQVIEQRIELERVAGIHQTSVDLLNNQLELNRAITEETIDLNNIKSKGLIDNQLEILRLQGATDLQLVRQRIELEKMYGINQNKTDLLRNELSLNQEITKEKLNQNKMSSDSLKIFDIFQKSGFQTAQEAGRLVTGQTDTFQKFSELSLDIKSVLENEFPQLIEQLKAKEFFFSGFGAGAELSIPERTTIQEFKPISLETLKLPDINTHIGAIHVEIKKMFKNEDTSKQIMDSLIDAIKNNPIIESAINEKIDSF
jgi:hypothetical protein